ncbi:MAG: hypothetical protein KatS3mg076_3267 [Candidatus Binatia bacterium]|nr:MAG: hypothetical protein KatS3mg076_3267 [Candidatus Binatia bacterium]
MPEVRRRPTFLEWIALGVGLVLLWRYRWILDDAFVYFRYIDNFLFLDLGLVYNRGEYVEGYSSPLWLLLLLGFRALRLDYWYVLLGVGVVAFLAFWWCLVELRRRTAPHGPELPVPALFLCGNYGVLCYFTSGMETPLVQLAAALFALFVFRPSSPGLQAALGLAPLLRHELFLPVALGAAWAWKRNRFPWTLVLVCLSTLGGWVLFRIYYYADFFPNTFYLKNTWEVRRGFVYLHETLSTYHLYELGALAVLGAWWTSRRGLGGRGAERLVLLAAAVVVAAYVVKIGGDARHYRYLAFPFVLAVCATSGIWEALFASLGLGRRSALVAGPAILLLGASFYPPQLDRHPITGKEKAGLVRGISDAAFHRHHPSLRHASWSRDVSPEKLLAAKASGTELHRAVLVDGWCARIYRRYTFRVVQRFGLTDPFLSRARVRANRAGHKLSLLPLAKDLAAIEQSLGWVGRGMFRAALAELPAYRRPQWVERNLAVLERIERRAYNRHDFLENLRLALRPVRGFRP